MIGSSVSGNSFPGLDLKAWASFSANGTFIKGFNVASTSRTALGRYTVTFTSAMATATYCAKVTGTNGGPPVYSLTKATGTCLVASYTLGLADLDADTYIEVWE